MIKLLCQLGFHSLLNVIGYKGSSIFFPVQILAHLNMKLSKLKGTYVHFQTLLSVELLLKKKFWLENLDFPKTCHEKSCKFAYHLVKKSKTIIIMEH